jgi:hypothetical protein
MEEEIVPEILPIFDEKEIMANVHYVVYRPIYNALGHNLLDMQFEIFTASSGV